MSSSKKRVQEITNMVTWVEAFTVNMRIFCCAHPSRWQDMTQCKLLILKTSRQFPGNAWLHYDTAFQKDAAASGLADWSRMNLDLYNFYTCLTPQSQPSASSSPSPNSGSLSSHFCTSWNDGTCCWPFGQCQYHHSCEKSFDQHSRATTPSQCKCQRC